MPEYVKLMQLDREIGHLQKRCTFAMLEDHKVHFGQLPILWALEEMGPCKQHEIAARMHNRPATVTVSLKRMEQSGLIKRQADPADARSKVIVLTEAGIQAAQECKVVLERILAHKYKGFSKQEITCLASFSSRIRENLISLQKELGANWRETD